MLAHSPCCSHARPLASPLVSRPRLGAYRPCLPVLPQAPHSHPQSRRCQLVAVAAKGKVQKDSLIDGRTVPADNPEARAFQKQTRGSPHKFRRALDAIRGRKYSTALIFMSYLPYRACEKVVTVLKSAAANAKDKYGIEEDDLFVSECYATQAGYLKRSQPRAKGRAYRILKPTSHVTIKVKQLKQANKTEDTTLAIPAAAET